VKHFNHFIPLYI